MRWSALFRWRDLIGHGTGAKNNMKPGKSSLELMRRLCGEIREDDGVDPREFVKRTQKRNGEKRHRQLCAQVRRCLDLVVPEILLRSRVDVCEILSVDPAPDASRLVVVVGVEVDRLDIARQTLAASKGALRAQVAQAVHRKKAPDLCFDVITRTEVAYGEQ